MKAKKNPPQCFYLDKEKLKTAKEIAAAEPGAAPFVSSNDIVTSGFARATNSKMITMAMDFRGRLEGLTTKHAGNYHLGLLFGPDGHPHGAEKRADTVPMKPEETKLKTSKPQ